MAKFSMKQDGKEVGPASVYAEPHDMTGKPGSIWVTMATAQASGLNQKTWP